MDNDTLQAELSRSRQDTARVQAALDEARAALTAERAARAAADARLRQIMDAARRSLRLGIVQQELRELVEESQ